MALLIALLMDAAAPATLAAPPAPSAIRGVHFDLNRIGSPTNPLKAERQLAGLVPEPCRASDPNEIVVCGRRPPGGQKARLPFPDDRAEPGEVIAYSDEPGSGGAGRSCQPPGACDPPKLMNTLGKILNWMKGNDPDPNVP